VTVAENIHLLIYKIYHGMNYYKETCIRMKKKLENLEAAAIYYELRYGISQMNYL
jgi:hypothetical protein